MLDELVKQDAATTITVTVNGKQYELPKGIVVKCIFDAIAQATAAGCVVPATLVKASRFRAPLNVILPIYLTDRETDCLINDDDPDLGKIGAVPGRRKRVKSDERGRPKLVSHGAKLEAKRQVIARRYHQSIGELKFSSVFQCYQHGIATQLGIQNDTGVYGSTSTKEYDWLRGLLGCPDQKHLRSIGSSLDTGLLPLQMELQIATLVEHGLTTQRRFDASDVRECIKSSLSYLQHTFSVLEGEIPPWLKPSIGDCDHILNAFMKRWKISLGIGRCITKSRQQSNRSSELEDWRRRTSEAVKNFRGKYYPDQSDDEFARFLFNADETYGKLGSRHAQSLRMRSVPHRIAADRIDSPMASMFAVVNAAGDKFPLHIVLKSTAKNPEMEVIQSFDGFSDDEVVPTVVHRSETGYFNRELFRDEVLPEIAKEIREVLGETISPQQPVILFMDNCSVHVHPEVELAASNLGILLMFLPPNTTHSMQPLDVGIFGTFKTKYFADSVRCLKSLRVQQAQARYGHEKVAVRSCKLKEAAKLQHSDMPNIYSIAWACVEREAIVKSFAVTGLWPFQETLPVEHDSWRLASDSEEITEHGTVAPHLVQAVNKTMEDILRESPTPAKHLIVLAMSRLFKDFETPFSMATRFRSVDLIITELNETPPTVAASAPRAVKRGRGRDNRTRLMMHDTRAKQETFQQEMEKAAQERDQEIVRGDVVVNPGPDHSPDPSRSPSRGRYTAGQMAVDENIEAAVGLDLEILQVSRRPDSAAKASMLAELQARRQEYIEAYLKGNKDHEKRKQSIIKNITSCLGSDVYEVCCSGAVHLQTLRAVVMRLNQALLIRKLKEHGTQATIPSPRRPIDEDNEDRSLIDLLGRSDPMPEEEMVVREAWASRQSPVRTRSGRLPQVNPRYQ